MKIDPFVTRATVQQIDVSGTLAVVAQGTGQRLSPGLFRPDEREDADRVAREINARLREHRKTMARQAQGTLIELDDATPFADREQMAHEDATDVFLRQKFREAERATPTLFGGASW